jgi:hypothetical protein
MIVKEYTELEQSVFENLHLSAWVTHHCDRRDARHEEATDLPAAGPAIFHFLPRECHLFCSQCSAIICYT